MRRRLAARWVLPVSGPPIERGAVLIGTDGRIEYVGPNSEVPRPFDAASSEFEDAALLPGLINTHTHLELTGFEGRITDPEFPDWIRSLRELKSTRAAEDYLSAARKGLADCYAAGVTTIADTGDSGAVIRALAESGASGIAYEEVFGPHPSQLEESFQGLQLRVDELSRFATSRARIGVSPHAPYTVSGPLFRAVAAWSQSEQLPLAVHVAESIAETQFLLAGSGPFARAWESRGIPLPDSRGSSPIAWLNQQGVLSPLTLCIHAVQLAPGDIEILAGSGAAVSHCPVSNRAHGHGVAPVAAMLGAGIRVGLGTDSVVSVGRLDLLAEARLAAKYLCLTSDQLLELCTLSGARALGLAEETGSLEPGKWADCTVIRIGPESEDPASRILASQREDVLRTYLAGKEVHRAG